MLVCISHIVSFLCSLHGINERCHVSVWFLFQAALGLGLGLDGMLGVNSTVGSRLWKWSGGAHADNSSNTTSANSDAMTQRSHRDGTHQSFLRDLDCNMYCSQQLVLHRSLQCFDTVGSVTRMASGLLKNWVLVC